MHFRDKVEMLEELSQSKMPRCLRVGISSAYALRR